jgi:RNA polymerase sigma-32 factor
MSRTALPALSESGLSHYMEKVRAFPMLSEEDEYVYAKAWAEHQDPQAAHKLVTSHLRLVVKIAMGYRGYGLPVTELISEGNIGLMQAVKKFDPERGFRLSTYAMWWIKASIQEYVLKSWSLVKMGTTAAQKKLFFNLRRVRHRIDASMGKDLTPEQVKTVAKELNVPEQDVIDMDQRMNGVDASLNASMGEDEGDEWIDLVEEQSVNQEESLSQRQDLAHRKSLLGRALATLNPREREIIEARQLNEAPVTLDDLSKKLHISRERVRQIESRAIEKLQQSVKAAYSGA